MNNERRFSELTPEEQREIREFQQVLYKCGFSCMDLVRSGVRGRRITEEEKNFAKNEKRS